MLPMFRAAPGPHVALVFGRPVGPPARTDGVPWPEIAAQFGPADAIITARMDVHPIDDREPSTWWWSAAFSVRHVDRSDERLTDRGEQPREPSSDRPLDFRQGPCNRPARGVESLSGLRKSANAGAPP
jgi:hypothetical protein